MTGQTLQSLQNYPATRQIIKSKDERDETSRIQTDLDLLNTKKADIDKTNTFSAAQTFNCAVKKNISTITTTPYSVLASDNIIEFDTTSNAIDVTLPDASNVLSQEFLFWLKTKGGSNNVTLKTASGDTVNVAGNNTMVFDAVDDWIKLIAVDNNRWLILGSNSITLSTT